MPIDNILKAYRESTLPSILLTGSFMFGGVFFLISGPFIHTEKIGEILIYLSLIPPVIYWMVKVDKSNDTDAQSSANHPQRSST